MASKDFTDESEEDSLTIQVLELPEFRGTIPEDLLDGLSKRERRTLATLDVVAQQVDWLCHRVIEQNAYMRRMEREQVRLRRFKNMILNKWSIISAIVLYFLPQLVPKLIAALK